MSYISSGPIRPLLELEPTPAPESPARSPSTLARASRKNSVLVIGPLAFVLSVCVGLGVLSFVGGLISTELPKVESIINDFMNAMVEKDVNKAYALFSGRSKSKFSATQLDLLQGNNYILFDGYEDVTITGYYLSKILNTNPDVPQGTVAKVSGTVSYKDNCTGTWNAILEKEGDEWRIYSINVTVPPDKFRR
jgi:hypothetical protein